MTSTYLRRIGTAATAIAGLAAAATLVASSADATVTGLTIQGIQHYGGVPYAHTGTVYTLVAACDRGTRAGFTDNGVPIGYSTPDGNGNATIQWKPPIPGNHVLVADGCTTLDQSYSDKQISVNVVNPAG